MKKFDESIKVLDIINPKNEEINDKITEFKIR
jgi:hypothetical protein